jgi:hypothetical protein
MLNEKCLGPMARLVAIAIDRGDQLLKGHAALSGDRLQTVPERVFKADARLVACNDNRALRNRKFHGFASLIWCFARQQTNPRQTTTRQQRRRKAQSRKFRSACHVRGLLSTATAQSA